jgi:hypothetical protein
MTFKIGLEIYIYIQIENRIKNKVKVFLRFRVERMKK